LQEELTKSVTERLDQLVDEETSRKFGELNIISDVSVVGDGTVRVKFSPLSPYSPTAVDIGREIRNAALAIKGVKHVMVQCSGHMMDELVNRLVNREEQTQK
jgi:metal-sulfur cluster biosynthetic enzyme